MLNSAASSAVNSARKRKKVTETDPLGIFDAATPTGIRSWMAQRDAPHGRPQQPAFRGEAVAAVEPPDEAQQQDEEAARTDHHAERVEQQRHVGHDLLRRCLLYTSDAADE